MASAYYAQINNMSFQLYEKSEFIGGNCRTIEIDNFKFDITLDLKNQINNKDSDLGTEEELEYIKDAFTYLCVEVECMISWIE